MTTPCRICRYGTLTWRGELDARGRRVLRCTCCRYTLCWSNGSQQPSTPLQQSA